MNVHIDPTKTKAFVCGVHGVSRGPESFTYNGSSTKRFLLAKRPKDRGVNLNTPALGEIKRYSGWRSPLLLQLANCTTVRLSASLVLSARTTFPFVLMNFGSSCNIQNAFAVVHRVCRETAKIDFEKCGSLRVVS